MPAMRTAFSIDGDCDGTGFGICHDFQIADDKALVKGDRTKSLQTIVGIVHELDSDF